MTARPLALRHAFTSFTLAALALGCGSGAAAETRAPGAAAEARPPVEPSPSETPEAEPAPEPPPPAVEPSQARDALGPDLARLVEDPERVVVARMRIIGALQAERARLTGDPVLAGYPILQERALPPEDVPADLREALLRDESYDFDILRRCAARRLVGVRFERGEARVELMLNAPCEQAVFVYRDGADVEAWGAILRPAVAARVFALVDGALPASP